MSEAADKAREIERIVREVMEQDVKPACVAEARSITEQTVVATVDYVARRIVREPWRSLRVGPWTLRFQIKRH